MQRGRKKPGLFVETQRWLTDPRLRGLSVRARQLLLELMVIAAGDRQRYGLVLLDGEPATVDLLSRFLGMARDDFLAAIGELGPAGLVDNDGGLVIPAMIADRERWEGSNDRYRATLAGATP